MNAFRYTDGRGREVVDIPVTGAPYDASIDPEDYDRVAQHTWSVQRKDDLLYATATIDSKKISLHRFILGLSDPQVWIDHKDGDGLNCRRRNMRVATRAQNSANSRKRRGKTSSQYKGVFPGRRGKKWTAKIAVSGKQRHLGTFESEQDAAMAYNEAAREAFGEFARLNDIRKPRARSTPGLLL